MENSMIDIRLKDTDESLNFVQIVKGNKSLMCLKQ